MSIWNFALKDRFEMAAHKLGYELEHTWGYIKMKIPCKDGRRFNCYLWTPLNKMEDLTHDGTRSPERALQYLRDNQDDFHIELESFPECYGHLFYDQLRDASVDAIVDAVKTILDHEECRQLDFIYELTVEDE